MPKEPRAEIPASGPSAIERENHWAVLALARFLLATWVMLAHTSVFLPRGVPGIAVPDGNALMAVYIFFAISGYSIRHSFERSPHGYARRRFWRIAPVYLACLLLAALGYFTIGEHFGVPKVMIWIGALFFLQSLFSKPMAVIYPAWSLSIEVLYYFTPLLLRRLSPWVPIYALVASGLFGAYRLRFMPGYVGNDTHGISVLALYWAWLAGWIAHGSKRNLGLFFLLAGVGTLIVVADPVHSPGLIPNLAGTLALNIVFWVGAILYLCYVEALRLPSAVAAVFDYLGELSYPLYLVHWPLFFFLFAGLLHQHPQFAHQELQVALALLFSVLIYTFIDRPMRSGRRPWLLAGLFALLVIFAGLAMAYHR